jgi:hypothetical protein
MSLPVDELSQAIEAHDWERCAEQAFRLLYPLPGAAAGAVAGATVARYLPTFRRNTPGLTWPERILADPQAWYREHGRATGEPPTQLGVADSSWLFCLDALLLGTAEPTDPVVRTAAWATAIVTAAGSRALAVWEIDDPEAVDLWRAGRLPQDRTYLANAAGRAVAEREWWWVAWRFAESLGHRQADADPDEVRAGIERWRDHEYRLLPPG